MTRIEELSALPDAELERMLRMRRRWLRRFPVYKPRGWDAEIKRIKTFIAEEKPPQPANEPSP